jgi:hypothetical protein
MRKFSFGWIRDKLVYYSVEIGRGAQHNQQIKGETLFFHSE